MTNNWENKIYGKLGSQLKLKTSSQLFFAQCSKCRKYDWQFGYYNGYQYCKDCLKKILIENGIIPKETQLKLDSKKEER